MTTFIVVGPLTKPQHETTGVCMGGYKCQLINGVGGGDK